MPESTAPDPVELWREMLTQWERSVNDVSNKVMTSGEFSNTANQLTAVVLKVQESLSDVLDKYFRALNLPSRKDVERLDERMMAIEDLLQTMNAVLERFAPPRPDAVSFEPELDEVATHVAGESIARNGEQGEVHDRATHVVVEAAASELPRKPKRSDVPVAKGTKRPPRTKRPPSKTSPAS